MIANTTSREILQHRSRCPKPFVREFPEFVTLRYPVFDPIRSIHTSRWVFYKKLGKDLFYMDEFTYTLRTYTLTELVEMAENVGWRLEAAYHNLGTLEPPHPEGSPINTVFRNKVTA
ncbi:hypothetical protein APE_0274 [Aeropyrum pernix K1]|uniref:Uncharacterized protein n=1 Tax=Aeropyrum pernix (strain ATCC 700893 / DSM 11879 / JCM 9820 / NBRC 100138 / K1) TaxID=272557 RepID=Q9YFH0_AERPE|nr:hypothetical protein [Aeropyrum pernix]BAA79191.1 hypothetical protein APE_0274 [Aeropyrum pernix K1]